MDNLKAAILGRTSFLFMALVFGYMRPEDRKLANFLQVPQTAVTD